MSLIASSAAWAFPLAFCWVISALSVEEPQVKSRAKDNPPQPTAPKPATAHVGSLLSGTSFDDGIPKVCHNN